MTQLELYNMALAHIGKTPLDSLSDNTESRIYCDAFYEITRKLFLKQSKLHLARKEKALSLASGESSVRYGYIYDMPADCEYPLYIYPESSDIEYVVESKSTLTSRVIKTDEPDATLVYVTDISNLNVYSPDDIIAMSYLLASFIVMPLKVDRQLKTINENEYLVALSVSQANDANMQGTRTINIDESYGDWDKRNR